MYVNRYTPALDLHDLEKAALHRSSQPRRFFFLGCVNIGLVCVKCEEKKQRIGATGRFRRPRHRRQRAGAGAGRGAGAGAVVWCGVG